MPVRLNELKGREKAAQVTYDGDVIDFGYFPHRVTGDLLEEVSTKAAADDLASVAAIVATVVSWWDVLDDNDKRIEPTRENIGQFPLAFVMAIMEGAQKDITPPA